MIWSKVIGICSYLMYWTKEQHGIGYLELK